MEKWSDELPFVAITICDKEGKIIDMNRRSIATYEKDGGKALIGKQLMDCHPERAKKIIAPSMVLKVRKQVCEYDGYVLD